MARSIIWLPPPPDLGFLPKFESWREDQLKGIDKVIQSDKRFVALTVPTGGGKSLLYMGAALLKKGVTRACVLTATKGLQDQAYRDFSSQPIGLRDVRGQRNYPCLAMQRGGALDRYRRGRYTPGCDEGPCHGGVRCALAPDRSMPGVRPDCNYYGAVHDASRAAFVSTNYAYWLTQNNHAKGIGAFDALILDEAHQAADELENFLAFNITHDDCAWADSKLMADPDVKTWKTWARQHIGALTAMVEAREAFPPQDAEGLHDLSTLKRVVAKFERLSELRADDWVIELGDSSRASFTPLRAASYAEEHLFRNIPLIILTSATLTAKTLALLGIDRQLATVWECPSSFAVERRPVIHVNPQPEVRVKHAMPEAHKLLWRRRIDRLLEPRLALGRKGIIHTVSYQRMKDLLALSDWKDYFITHDSGNTLDAVAEFKRRDEPCVLLSPSIMTGYDFPYNECRFQIIGKVPLLDTRSALLTVRQDTDPDYAFYVAMQRLVQAVGRGMRAQDDWCETLIVDDAFEWFIKRAGKFAPRWFLDAVDWTRSLPDPLDPDTFVS